MGPLLTYMFYVSLTTLVLAASYDKSVAKIIKDLPNRRAGLIIAMATSAVLELPLHTVAFKIGAIFVAKLFGVLGYWFGWLFLLGDILNILVLCYFYVENIKSVEEILKQLPETNAQDPKFSIGSLLSRTLTPSYHSTHKILIYKGVSYYTPEDQLDESVSALLLNGEGLMDIYTTSRNPSASPKKPVVIYIHGGAWKFGSKEIAYPIVKILADQGFLVLNINYRLSGVQPMPAGFNDVQKVIKWTKENISAYGGDQNFILTAGDSAGAHLATLAALSGAHEASTQVQGTILISAALDVTDQLGLDPGRRNFFLNDICAKNNEVLKSMSPLTRLVAGIEIPPMLAFHAVDDILSNGLEAKKFGMMVKELGGAHTLVELQKTQHGFMLFNSPKTLTMGEAAADWASKLYSESKKKQ